MCVRVGRDAVAEQLGVDLRAARLRVLELLEHEHRGGLAHHEPVPLGVERPRGALRVVVPPRDRAHRAEAGDPDARDRRLRAAAEHDVRAAEPDRVEPVADRHVRRGAGRALRGSGPRVPSSIETQPAAMFGMIWTIENGLTRSGPRSSQRVMQAWKDLRPPIPVAIEAPTGRRSAAMSSPESASACRAAARTICVKRSIRRACLRSIQSVGSKSFSSQAKWIGKSVGSNCVIGPAPDSPASSVRPGRLHVVAERASPSRAR